MAITSILSLCATTLTSCSSASKQRISTVNGKTVELLPLNPAKLDDRSFELCKSWATPLGANLSYVTINGPESNILVSTSSEHGAPKGMNARVKWLSSTGKTLWSHWLPQPVKGQSIDPSGKFAFISNYEEVLYTYTNKGATAWKKKHLATPVADAQKLIVLNEDDADADVAFFTYAFSGKLLGKASIKHGQEPIDFSISTGATHVAMIKLGGNWSLHNALDGNAVLEGKFEGHGASIAYSKDQKSVIVLHTPDKESQRVTAFSSETGKELWSKRLKNHFIQSRLFEKDKTLVLYGNSTVGQVVAGIDITDGDMKWEHTYPGPNVYTSPLLTLAYNGDHLLVFFVDKTPGDETILDGTLHLLGLRTDGTLAFETAVQADSGIFGASAMATKDGRVQVVFGNGTHGQAVLNSYKDCHHK